MDAMFGIPMDTIMTVLLVLLGLCLGTILLVFLRNRIFFLMGLRNIPRRMAQTVLIVIGLMLSTIIITAAFTIGDTVDYSITKQAYETFGHTDRIVEPRSQNGAAPGDGQRDMPAADYQRFLAAMDAAAFPGIDGYAGVLREEVPVVNPRTRLSDPNVTLTGLDAPRMAAFPDIIDASSGEALFAGALPPGSVYMNESAAGALDVRAGDAVEVYVRGEAHPYTVAAVVEDRWMTGVTGEESREGMAASMAEVQRLFGHDHADYIAVSYSGGIRGTLHLDESVQGGLEGLIAEEAFNLALGNSKAQAVELAEEMGNFMTTFFLLLGLFSIGAGILLILMIFVMLAAERKPEMGMARAIGTKRLHLIEMFLSEGMAYNLAAAMAGVVLGIIVAFGLALSATRLFAEFGLTFEPHVTLRTVIVSYSLGVVLTFITVSFSSWRISNLNIVRAIRDIPEPAGRRMGWRGLAFWTLAVVLGALLFVLGLNSDTAFPFALGSSLIMGGLAVLLTRAGLPARPAYTTMGATLLVFWGLVAGGRLEPLFGPLEGDIEMFFLSGIAMVTASTFVLIYNADLFLGALARIGGAASSLLPALRTAVAYPLANRFRTGMTLAMISLVIFALTMMSAMNLNFDRLFLADEARGGWDVRVIENPNSPLPGLRAALAESGSAAADEIRSAGTLLFAGSFDLWDQLPLTLGTEVSQSGDWENYPVIGVTASMVDGGRIPLDKRAEGYDSDEAVWQAIRDGGNVALIDAIAAQSGFYPSDFALDGIGERDRTFEPVPLRVRDPVSGISREVLIIGVIGLGSSTNFTGVFVPEDTFRGVFGDPQLSIHYVALNDPGRAADAAREIETALVSAGVQAESLKEIADRENAASRNFLYLMQSFMGLGLVVGIAAVGVIAFRTVVERRQQIGMLRAIGYKRSTVALSFLMESAFVTLLGILAGITLALWLSYFLITSDEFPATSAGYAAPWLHIIVIGTLTFLASLLMTWIPSRQAASIPTAEALRYE